MSAFQAALKNYKAGTPSAPPVNPPEAVKVLEEQAAPEVANTAPKDAPPVTASSASASGPAPAPAASGAKPRTRRTKAEMDAARAATQSPDAAGNPVGLPELADLPTEDLISELQRRGYHGSLNF